jgi:hypothetical protein
MKTRTSAKRTAKRSTKTKTRKNNQLQNQFIPAFIQMLNTVKLYHWKTTSYSTHKATDQLYSDLNQNIDEFVEILLGKPSISLKNRYSLLDVKLVKLNKYNNNEDFKKQIENYKNFLISFSEDTSFNIPSNSDLINKRDELLGIMNQFLYLLTLKN